MAKPERNPYGIMDSMKFSLINQSNDLHLPSFRKNIVALNKRIASVLSLPKSFSYAVILIDDRAMKTINFTYRHLDQTTDVISFALNDGIDELEAFVEELGDIFISVDVVYRQAEAYGHSVQREFLFLVAHGVLHLLGYDHQTAEDEKCMFDLQKELLHDLAPR